MQTLVSAKAISTRAHTALSDAPAADASDRPESEWSETWRLMPNEPHSIVFWEMTPGCDQHSDDRPFPSISRSLSALSTFESYKLIDQVAALSPNEFVLTGGDPLRRNDLHELIRYARRRSLDPALLVTPGTRLTYESIAELKRSGLTRLIFDVDGSSPSVHDGIHDDRGAFAAATRAMRWARTMDLSVEVNTLITRRNADDLVAIVDLIRQFSIERWNIYFVVPAEMKMSGDVLTANETENAFATIYAVSQSAPFEVRTVEAPHYRRFLLQRALESQHKAHEAWTDFSAFDDGDDATMSDVVRAAVAGPNGYVFISHAGEVRASEFLPLPAGNVRYRPLPAIYRDAPLFEELRDPSNLKGKCGHCEFKEICGGSRARAWAMTADLFASDPLCAYRPGRTNGAKENDLALV